MERNEIPQKKLVLWNSSKITTKGFVCTSKVDFSDTIIDIFGCRVLFCADILEQSMGARNWVRIGLLYRPAELNRLAESIPWIQLLHSLKFKNTALSWFLFHGMVQNGIPRVYLYFLLHEKEFRLVFSSAEWFGAEFREFAFDSTEWNSELWSLPQKGSEQNYGSFLLFLLLRTEFRGCFLFRGRERNSKIFCSAE